MHSTKISTFQKHLIGWFKDNQRDLPWRHTRDPYYIWISEVMLQQTQVITVIPYYLKFISAFPSIYDLASADQQKILKQWQGLGYYSRARNMQKAAQTIVNEFKGAFPKNYQNLLKLSGIGPYIAAAVSSIAWNLPFAVVDGNVKRVLSRLYCHASPVNNAKFFKHFQALADQLLYQSDPGEYNQAIMELGALICVPSSPKCITCPVVSCCEAYKRRVTDQFPVKIKKKAIPTRQMAALLIEKENQILMWQNDENGLLGGLWSVPLILRSEMDETIKQMFQVSDIVAEMTLIELSKITHTYTHFKEDIIPQILKTDHKLSNIKGESSSCWVTMDQVNKLPITGVCQKILKTYYRYKKKQ